MLTKLPTYFFSTHFRYPRYDIRTMKVANARAKSAALACSNRTSKFCKCNIDSVPTASFSIPDAESHLLDLDCTIIIIAIVVCEKIAKTVPPATNKHFSFNIQRLIVYVSQFLRWSMLCT